MTRIGVLSDTHGWLDPKIPACLEACDEVWHLGDIGSLSVTDVLGQNKVLRAVYGNIDDKTTRCTFPEYLHFNIEKCSVLMTHIGGKPGKYSGKAMKWIRQYKPQLFLCGHSHILKVGYDHKNNLLYMNPGAAGRFGIHNKRTLLRFTIDGAGIKDLEVVETGSRGV